MQLIYIITIVYLLSAEASEREETTRKVRENRHHLFANWIFDFHVYVRVISGLGEQCFQDDTCQLHDKHAVCAQVDHNALCKCKQGYHIVIVSRPTNARSSFCAQGKFTVRYRYYFFLSKTLLHFGPNFKNAGRVVLIFIKLWQKKKKKMPTTLRFF